MLIKDLIKNNIFHHRLALLANILLRAITLGARFLLIFFLARYLVPADLGMYGLLIATIGYALYFLGLDFYTFTTRELLKKPTDKWGGLLKSHGGLALTLYAIFLPILLSVFWSGSLPWSLVYWFFVLVVLEHINQELMRLLIAISEPLMANAVLFFRQGLWAVIVAGVMYFCPALRSLEFVLLAWCIGGALALLLAVYRLHQLRIEGWSNKIDWHWIGQGLKVALPLLVATLALRALFTIDRYWVEALGGLEVLGAYVLFVGFSNALLAFLDAGVFAFIYPGLIRSFQKQDAPAYKQGLKKLAVQTVVLSIVFVVFASFLIGPLLIWLDKPLYVEQQALFPWVLLATVIYAIGMVPHYALYAQGLDTPIIKSHIVGLLVFVVVTWLLATEWPDFAVPIGVAIAFTFIFAWKMTAYVQLTPIEFQPYNPKSEV
ncbi:lipopolysaccharide biosynthesis protein [Pseudomonas segetis]|uniref:Membrane protein involved in the export of O-antigen and teichoic acid n=1 Tax=Pseudomonas segetis TaxID=298908 RepID=A0A239A4Z2_9PSED|nr:oligosaccharide flippase family protein [Pseudomonas segetis]SNR90579.1 Membrane protein involved in the export of O-antigen and teichoic acid [Pseudomonas segetis]